MTSGQGHGTPLSHGQQLCEILSRSNMTLRSYGKDTVLVSVHCDLDLGSSPWVKVMAHPWVMTNNVWNIIQIQHGNEELYPRHWFLVCAHYDHDLLGMILGQGHDTPLGHAQQLCKILSRSNMAVRSYGLDTDFGYVCTVILTSEIWPWIKVMTHPWVMNNNCLKYYPDRTRR